MTEEEQKKIDAYGPLVEALKLSTRALERAKLAGAEYRVQESRELLQKLGEAL